MKPLQIKKSLLHVAHQVAEDLPGWALYASEAELQFSNVLSGAIVSVSGQELCHFLKDIKWDGPQTELHVFLKRSLEGLLLAYDLAGCRATWFGSLSYRGEGRSIGTQSGAGANLGEHGPSRRKT